METAQDDEVGPNRETSFVTATDAEIAYAEELLRRIELRYLHRPAEPRAVPDTVHEITSSS